MLRWGHKTKFENIMKKQYKRQTKQAIKTTRNGNDLEISNKKWKQNEEKIIRTDFCAKESEIIDLH